MSLFRPPPRPAATASASPAPAASPAAPAAVPSSPFGPPSPGELAYRLEHTVGYDGSRLREQWGSPAQFQPADVLPDAQARQLLAFLTESR